MEFDIVFEHNSVGSFDSPSVVYSVSYATGGRWDGYVMAAAYATYELEVEHRIQRHLNLKWPQLQCESGFENWKKLFWITLVCHPQTARARYIYLTKRRKRGKEINVGNSNPQHVRTQMTASSLEMYILLYFWNFLYLLYVIVWNYLACVVWQHFDYEKQREPERKWLKFVKSLNCDIVCFQETHGDVQTEPKWSDEMKMFDCYWNSFTSRRGGYRYYD
jgi:hypothetical protein